MRRLAELTSKTRRLKSLAQDMITRRLVELNRHLKGGGGGDEEGISKGGLSGGMLLDGEYGRGSSGYRRRRGHLLDICYVIDKSHFRCHDNDDWDRSMCIQASQKEYDDNKACYDCQDDECIKGHCGQNAEVCHPGNETCTCCSCQPSESTSSSPDESDDVQDECWVVNGKCTKETAHESCCGCFTKVQNNVKCDEEPKDRGIVAEVIAILGGSCLVLAVLKFAYDDMKKKCGANQERYEEPVIRE